MACDAALRGVSGALGAERVLGIGNFAAGRARAALAGAGVQLGVVPHPSPASPLANRDWPGAFERALAGNGVTLPLPERARAAGRMHAYGVDSEEARMTTGRKPWRALAGHVLLGVAAAAIAGFPAPAAGQAAGGDEVTFSRDIAPILQRSCQKCHRPDSLAPMSLIDYEEVRPWARAIKHRTGLRDKPGVMPPWYIEKDIGIQRFKDDPSLSDAEIAMIAAWADNGAPQGDPADLPPPLAFIDVDEWEIGEPDLILSSPSFTVEADQPDWWGSIGEVPTGLTEDRYVAAMEYKEVTESREGTTRNTVGGLFVVHHATLGVTDPNPDPNENDPLARCAAGRPMRSGATPISSIPRPARS